MNKIHIENHTCCCVGVYVVLLLVLLLVLCCWFCCWCCVVGFVVGVVLLVLLLVLCCCFVFVLLLSVFVYLFGIYLCIHAKLHIHTRYALIDLSYWHTSYSYVSHIQ